MLKSHLVMKSWSKLNNCRLKFNKLLKRNQRKRLVHQLLSNLILLRQRPITHFCRGKHLYEVRLSFLTMMTSKKLKITKIIQVKFLNKLMGSNNYQPLRRTSKIKMKLPHSRSTSIPTGRPNQQKASKNKKLNLSRKRQKTWMNSIQKSLQIRKISKWKKSKIMKTISLTKWE